MGVNSSSHWRRRVEVGEGVAYAVMRGSRRAAATCRLRACRKPLPLLHQPVSGTILEQYCQAAKDNRLLAAYSAVQKTDVTSGAVNA